MKYTMEDKERIVAKFKELRDGGASRKSACKEAGVSDNSIFHWMKMLENGTNKQDGVRQVVKVDRKQTKVLLAENQRLKNIVANLMLDLECLKEYRS